MGFLQYFNNKIQSIIRAKIQNKADINAKFPRIYTIQLANRGLARVK
jgi:hypothetical protein